MPYIYHEVFGARKNRVPDKRQFSPVRSLIHFVIPDAVEPHGGGENPGMDYGI
jgi:hypothetical protein